MRVGLWRWIRIWIPIVKFHPALTFCSRLRTKLQANRLKLLSRIWKEHPFHSAVVVGVAANGNRILKFRRGVPLGKKGALLQIPQDEIIFEEVRRFGHWETSESLFLGQAMARLQKGDGVIETLLLDIGANTGLVTLQTLLSTKLRPRVVVVEPITRHVEAIKYNLREISRDFQIEVLPFALAPVNGFATIYTEARNHGNTSLLRDLMPSEKFLESEIVLMAVSDFVENHLQGNESIFLKSDTQGFDARILSRFPADVWHRVEAAVIEVWAMRDIESEDVEKCLQNWKGFRYASWSAGGRHQVSLTEISDFWLSKSLDSRNLFLRR